MQTDMEKKVEWCKTWSMELSQEKCKVMHLGKQSSPKDYFIAEINWELLSARGV